jgi:hypothetical protein
VEWVGQQTCLCLDRFDVVEWGGVRWFLQPFPFLLDMQPPPIRGGHVSVLVYASPMGAFQYIFIDV